MDKIFKIAPCGLGQDVGLGAHGLFHIGIEQRQRAACVEHLSRADDDQQHSGHARKAHAHCALACKQPQAARQNQARHQTGSTQQQGRQSQKVVGGGINALAVNVYHQPAHGGFVKQGNGKAVARGYFL